MSQQLWIKMANLVFELGKKAARTESAAGLQRTIARMRQVLEEAGLLILRPLGETFSRNPYRCGSNPGGRITR